MAFNWRERDNLDMGMGPVPFFPEDEEQGGSSSPSSTDREPIPVRSVAIERVGPAAQRLEQWSSDRLASGDMQPRSPGLLRRILAGVAGGAAGYAATGINGARFNPEVGHAAVDGILFGGPGGERERIGKLQTEQGLLQDAAEREQRARRIQLEDDEIAARKANWESGRELQRTQQEYYADAAKDRTEVARDANAAKNEANRIKFNQQSIDFAKGGIIPADQVPQQRMQLNTQIAGLPSAMQTESPTISTDEKGWIRLPMSVMTGADGRAEMRDMAYRDPQAKLTDRAEAKVQEGMVPIPPEMQKTYGLPDQIHSSMLKFFGDRAHDQISVKIREMADRAKIRAVGMMNAALQSRLRSKADWDQIFFKAGGQLQDDKQAIRNAAQRELAALASQPQFFQPEAYEAKRKEVEARMEEQLAAADREFQFRRAEIERKLATPAPGALSGGGGDPRTTPPSTSPSEVIRINPRPVLGPQTGFDPSVVRQNILRENANRSASPLGR